MTETRDSALIFIDDNPAERYLLDTCFSRADLPISIRTCANTREAAELIDGGEIAPALVVVDINLGPEDGIDWIASTQQAPTRQALTFWVLSSSGLSKDKARASSAGATAFYTKNDMGLQYEHLIDEVRRHLQTTCH